MVVVWYIFPTSQKTFLINSVRDHSLAVKHHAYNMGDDGSNPSGRTLH
jgi:hypothetical protein